MVYDFLGVTPIRPEAPAGSDVRSDPEYEALNLEIEKMANPSAGAGTDWRRTAELSSNLLAAKGKDLQVACYLGVALIQLQQVQGLSIALQILGDLIENFWDAMFPPLARIRGRRNALEWWLERTIAAMSAVSIGPLPLEEFEILKGRFKRFDDLLREKDPEGPLLNRLAALINGLSVQETAKPAAEAGAAAQDGGLSGPLDDADKALELALGRLGQIAAALRDRDIANALAYRLTRFASWTQLEQVPPVNEGRTSVPPPPSQDVDTLRSLRAGGEGEAVVRFAESRLAEYPLWLDLSRASSEGLASLGARAAEAEATVRRETANLIARLPGLEAAVFSDGTPFADSGTAAWMSGLSAASTNGSGPPTTGGLGLDVGLATAIKDAQQLADQGRFLDAVGALDSLNQTTASERVRMLVRLRICEMILANNSGRDLRPYLAPLLEAIERHHLESWEPALATQALILIYRGTGDGSEPGCGLPARADILKRIALIDYGQALKLAAA
jgi:type VI secretion system protein VasJ